MKKLCGILARIAKKIPLIFPVHPRTKKNLENFGLWRMLTDHQGIILAEPLSYIRFMNLVFNCRFTLTDSGGIQEETTYLKIPCLTMRPNTERPITIEQGTNRLCTFDNMETLAEKILSLLPDDYLKVQFNVLSTRKRQIEFSASGHRFNGLLRELGG